MCAVAVAKHLHAIAVVGYNNVPSAIKRYVPGFIKLPHPCFTAVEAAQVRPVAVPQDLNAMVGLYMVGGALINLLPDSAHHAETGYIFSCGLLLFLPVCIVTVCAVCFRGATTRLGACFFCFTGNKWNRRRKLIAEKGILRRNSQTD
jgi:hypothetical protein